MTFAITFSELQNNLGKFAEAALLEPVFVTKDGKELALLSGETFHEMQRYTREVLPVEALGDATIAAIAAAEAPAEYAYLDRELDNLD